MHISTLGGDRSDRFPKPVRPVPPIFDLHPDSYTKMPVGAKPERVQDLIRWRSFFLRLEVFSAMPPCRCRSDPQFWRVRETRWGGQFCENCQNSTRGKIPASTPWPLTPFLPRLADGPRRRPTPVPPRPQKALDAIDARASMSPETDASPSTTWHLPPPSTCLVLRRKPRNPPPSLLAPLIQEWTPQLPPGLSSSTATLRRHSTTVYLQPKTKHTITPHG